MKACTRQQRAYLAALPRHNFQLWGKIIDELKVSKHSVSKWLRDDRFKKVRELLDEIAIDDLDVGTRRIITEYSRIAFADIRGVFDSEGRLLPPHEWPDEVAAAVESVETQEKRLKGADGQFINEWELVRKIRSHDKLRALEFLATWKRIAGAKRVEVTGADGAPLQAPAPVINFIERAD
jgi:hypothetical protein